MKGSQDILFGVANQRLLWDAPEGRPSNVLTWEVFASAAGDDGVLEDASSGSPTVDLVSTTVDQASGDGQANPRLLYVADTGNMVVGRSYLVAAAGGAREWVDVIGIADDDYVTVRYPMANSFASGATVVGTRIVVPLRTAWISDLAKLTGGRDPIPGYRVRWVYTVASAQYVHDSYFDLVRYAGGHTLTAVDVDREFPGVKGMAPGFHRVDDMRALLDQGYERVRWDLVDVELDDNAVMDQDALNRATLFALGVLLARSRVLQGGDPRVLELAERDYETFMTKVFRVGQKIAIATDSSGAGGRSSSPAILVR